ncbi:MAG: SMC family ATPase [Anaerolineae bacterium]
MWISKLELRDIKSYGPEGIAIQFREGVNLIRGKNGAGKSTLLEAIGLALFDHKPYRLASFVREGARSGRIAVRFVSERDEREYEVVRTVGTGANAYIYDPEVRNKPANGMSETYAFIREHLGVDMDTDLAALFRDAVGVPQGTMTAIFLEAAAARKEKFNRLLRIDAYERAWSSLSATTSHINGLIQDNQQRQATLQGVLQQMPAVESRHADLETKIEQTAAELARLEAEAATIQADLELARGKKEARDMLARQFADAEEQVRLQEHDLAAVRDRLDEALKAVQVIEDAQAGFEAYEQARQELEQAETERSARDQLRQTMTELKARRQSLAETLEQIETELAQLDDVQAKVAALAQQVPEQDRLQAALRDAERAEAQMVLQQNSIERQRSQYDALRTELDTQVALLTSKGIELPPLEDGNGAIATSDDALIALQRALPELKSRIERWTRVFEEAEAQADDLARLREAAGVREQVVQAQGSLRVQIDALEEELTDLRQKSALAKHEQEQLASFEVMLAEAGAICPVCRQTVDDHAQHEAQAHYRAERERLSKFLEVARVQEAELQARLAGLEAEEESLQRQLAQLPDENAVRRAADDLARLEQERDGLATQCVALAQKARALAERFEVLFAMAENELRELQQRASAIIEIRGQLEALGDPRSALEVAQSRLAALNQKRAELEDRRAQLNQLDEALASTQAALAPYADLDDRIAALRQQQSATLADYERFVANRDLAGQVPEIRTRLEEYQAKLTEARARADALQQELQEAEVAFDAEAYQVLEARQRTLEQDLAGVRARLEMLQGNLTEAAHQLAQLREKADALAALQVEAARLAERREVFAFVRQIIRDAGPLMTQQLVRLIAAHANQLFGEILGDHSLILNWSDDYAISINSRGEARDYELLSGGEQMVAAIAIRLALLTQLTNVRFAFFDEPTTNLDEVRRGQLAEQIGNFRSLRQLFVISHDDTFEQESYYVLQVHKVNGLSQVEVV